METSNLIALSALMVAIVGLIPQFHQMFPRNKSKKPIVRIAKAESNLDALDKGEEKKKPMPFMLRILILITIAVAVFLIEIILFGIVAHFFDVKVDLATMSLLWKIIFYSLFFIPGTFLFLALLVFVANTDD